MTYFFHCPRCRGELTGQPTGYHCPACDHTYPIQDGIPDFFTADSGHDFSTDANTIWLEPHIAAQREIVYRHCARQLHGMAFCIAEMARRTTPGSRVLEVGTGTGHFTRWLAEEAAPDTEIYSFDFSWPILELARQTIAGLSGIILCRANAREGLPFPPEAFDIVFTRLAPLGPRGVSNVEAAYPLLKPGGWYVWAGWEAAEVETPPTEWALQHGYSSASFHRWQYRRLQCAEEARAWEIERDYLLGFKEGRQPDEAPPQAVHETMKMTYENVLLAQKPVN